MATALLTLLLVGAPDAATEPLTPKFVAHLKADEKDKALAVLREIRKKKGDHDEAKALVKAIRSSRPEKSPEVMEAAFLALQGIGSKKITRSLIALLDWKRLRKRKEVRIGICRALEGSADPRAVDDLIDFMRDVDNEVIAAAGQAAGAYRYSKESVRKELFEKVMNIYVATWNQKTSIDPDEKVEQGDAEEKWEFIEQPFEKSMQLLSNVTQNSPPDWRRWWNKHKNKRWADLEG